jgi:hypothetical protein
MSGSPGGPTLLSVIFDADRRHVSAIGPYGSQEELDPFGGSCGTCPHPPFIHSDRGHHPCLYSGCECSGYAEARDPPSSAEANEEAEAPVVAVISTTYLVLAGGARPGRRSSTA